MKLELAVAVRSVRGKNLSAENEFALTVYSVRANVVRLENLREVTVSRCLLFVEPELEPLAFLVFPLEERLLL